MLGKLCITIALTTLLATALAAMGCATGETPDVSATVAAELTRLAPTPTTIPTPAPTFTPTPTKKSIRLYWPTPTPTKHGPRIPVVKLEDLPPTPIKKPTPTPTTVPPKITISQEPAYNKYGRYCHYGIRTAKYASGTSLQFCLELPLNAFECPPGYQRKPDRQRRDWAYSGYDKTHDIKNQCNKIHIAPIPTPLPYKISYKTYNYSAPSHGVTNIPICFEEHTHHNDGKTYTQDVRYHTKYKDRQGRGKSLTITFVLFDRGKRTEHIQAYESSSPGTFDDAPTSAIIEAFKGIKSGKWQPHHGGCN